MAGIWQAAGMGLVILSFILSFFYIQYAGLILVAYPALLVGFPLWNWARGAVRRWDNASKTVGEIDAELKGLNAKYTLFHFVDLGKQVPDAVLLSPDGILLVEMKEGGGVVTCAGGKNGEPRWSQKIGILERLARFGEEPLGNPTAETAAKITALRTFLAGQSLDRPNLPIDGVVVFRDPRTALTVDDSGKYEVLRLNELKRYVQTGPPDEKREVFLPTDERNRVAAALRALVPAEPVKDKDKDKEPAGRASRPAATPSPPRPKR